MGALNALLIPVILLFVALMGISAFAYSEYAKATDYQTNTDQKIEAAVAKNSETVSAQKEKDFAEKEKFPYNTYIGPEAAGSLKLEYPKTWSAYINAPKKTTTIPLEGWWYPGQVPSTGDDSNSYALRVKVEQKSYDTIMKAFQGYQKAGKVTIQPYQSANVPSVIGSRIDGEITTKKQGSMVVLPFRDKTLSMWTESADYKGDFDNIILKNFMLTP
jgi:hypothetical protein